MVRWAAARQNLWHLRRELQVGVCRDKEKLVDPERSRIVTARSALNEIKFQSDSELV